MKHLDASWFGKIVMTNENISRRKYIKYIGGAAAVAVAAAAGYGIYQGSQPPVTPTTTTAATTATPPPTAIAAKTKIVFQWDMWLQDLPHAWLLDNQEKFNQENPDIEVQVVGLNDWEVNDKLTHMIASGTVYDGSDLYYSPAELAVFQKMGAVEPLDDYITPEEKAKIFPSYLEALTMADEDNTKKLFALPGQIIADALFYNTRMFQEAGLSGPPDTLDDFEEACKLLTKPGKQWGWGMENWRVYYIWDNWIYTRGGRYFNEDGKSAVNEKPCVEHLEWMRNLREEGWIYPEFLKSYEWRTQFGLEKIGMFTDGNWMIGANEVNFPNFKTWDIAFLPRLKGATIRGAINPQPVVMFKQSKHKRETWKWLQRLWFNDESCRGYAKAKWGLPWRTDWQQIGVELSDYEKRGYIDQAAAGAYTPHEVYPKPAYVSDRIAVAFQEAVLGKKSPQKALDDAAADIDKTLAYG
jgi:multiple sugar transport system substrate-binding protein